MNENCKVCRSLKRQLDLIDQLRAESMVHDSFGLVPMNGGVIETMTVLRTSCRSLAASVRRSLADHLLTHEDIPQSDWLSEFKA